MIILVNITLVINPMTEVSKNALEDEMVMITDDDH